MNQLVNVVYCQLRIYPKGNLSVGDVTLAHLETNSTPSGLLATLTLPALQRGCKLHPKYQETWTSFMFYSLDITEPFLIDWEDAESSDSDDESDEDSDDEPESDSTGFRRLDLGAGTSEPIAQHSFVLHPPHMIHFVGAETESSKFFVFEDLEFLMHHWVNAEILEVRYYSTALKQRCKSTKLGT
ncbi:hypothetical protein B0H14DRAFT_2966314 [Mycena olivaceomarginata]|nr:hypothetical protein B0H14DRAFT_2966314 [Mycena olivaceomarginata]